MKVKIIYDSKKMSDEEQFFLGCKVGEMKRRFGWHEVEYEKVK